MPRLFKWAAAIGMMAAAVLFLPWGNRAVHAAENGLVLDASRQFYTPAQIRAYIDRVAAGHGRFLQLHLTDNERFGIESATLGQTTQAATVKAGIYYNRQTQQPFLSKAQVNALVNYGQQRGVAVIPEIDVPAHATALFKLLGQMPNGAALVKQYRNPNDASEINLQSTAATAFAQRLIGEYTDLVKAGHYLSVGMDEYASTETGHNTDGVRFAKALHATITAAGRKMVMWNDGIQKVDVAAYPKDIRVMYWSQTGEVTDQSLLTLRRHERATVNDLTKAGFKVVNSNFSYLYVITTPKMFAKDHVPYWQKELKTHWQRSLWDNYNTKNRDTSPNVIGSALGIWGTTPNDYSSATVLKKTQPFITTFFSVAK